MPLLRFRPLPATPRESAHDAIRCKWKLQWMLPWPPAGVPGQCTLRMRGEGAGRGGRPQARGRSQTLAAPSRSPPRLGPPPTHLSGPVPFPPSSVPLPGSQIPPPAPPRRPPPPGPLPRPSSSPRHHRPPRRPGPGPPVGPAAPIPAAARPLTPSRARRGPAR